MGLVQGEEYGRGKFAFEISPPRQEKSQSNAEYLERCTWQWGAKKGEIRFKDEDE